MNHHTQLKPHDARRRELFSAVDRSGGEDDNVHYGEAGSIRRALDLAIKNNRKLHGAKMTRAGFNAMERNHKLSR